MRSMYDDDGYSNDEEDGGGGGDDDADDGDGNAFDDVYVRTYFVVSCLKTTGTYVPMYTQLCWVRNLGWKPLVASSCRS